ncbi:hypothetical protein [Thermomonas fusca]
MVHPTHTAGEGPTANAAPFTSRPLTLAEEKRLDLYYYHSPKNGERLVSVVEPCRLAIALELEFDVDVTNYVERPRTLLVDEREVELCFWIRRRSAAETFVVFRRQPKPSVPALRAEERFCSKLVDAANTAGLSITIRKPASILASRVANATRLELLPYAQAAERLEGIDVFLSTILAHMESNPRSSFHTIERSLCGPFDWRDVRSATCLLIHRGVLAIDFNEKLKVSSAVLLTGDRHA